MLVSDHSTVIETAVDPQENGSRLAMGDLRLAEAEHSKNKLNILNVWKPDIFYIRLDCRRSRRTIRENSAIAWPLA